jgi:hypothetical protein
MTGTCNIREVKEKMFAKFWSEILMARDHMEDLGTDWMATLKCVL